MSTFPGSPRLLKAAIVALDALSGGVPNVIVLQYNPDTLQRTLQPLASGDDGSRAEAFRLNGPPVETIRLEAVLDTADQLERPEQHPLSVSHGLHPILAALEMLVSPSSSRVIANAALGAAGVIEVLPPLSALTLFVWGPSRVMPVRISELSITEEAFDQQLNPSRARASLGLRVLSTNDLAVGTPGYALALAHHMAREALAVAGMVAGAQAAGSFSFALGAQGR
jgi:hypothetical protein